MKQGFYPRLAADGIRKNRRLYVPYLLTCICMVAIHYILTFLSHSETVCRVRGASVLCSTLQMGADVVLVFSAIFLFYTNSFLIRRRKREFGLYNVLGMGKNNLGRIITWEALLTAVISLILGILLGVIASKLAELGLLNLMGCEVDFRFAVSMRSIYSTTVSFLAIFVLIWFSGVLRVRRSSAVSLMKSENVGEKPPKANWLLGFIGFILLGVAYYLAVTVENPVSAILYFFIAVLLVILATYLLMIAGSVMLCRILQKNKKYYYDPRHFVSVSSMAYRMKRNGAGLASVCILATMVLVMLSSTSSLYFGSEDALNSRYPREINLELHFNKPEDMNEENLNWFRERAQNAATKLGYTAQNFRTYRRAEISGLLEKDGVQVEYETQNVNVNLLTMFYFVPLEDYVQYTGETVDLPEGKAALRTFSCSFTGDTLTFKGHGSLSVAEVKPGSIQMDESALGSFDAIIVIVKDLEDVADILGGIGGDEEALQLSWLYGFDLNAGNEAQRQVDEALQETFCGWENMGAHGCQYYSSSTRAAGSDDYYASNGGLFFIGILLSLVFILAAVLILYYKQISEGYEDQNRFHIMQKVGMTKKAIRRSINSQLLLVFFLPLFMAGIHLCFAFPMIRKLLTLFALYNVGLFAATTVISYCVFCLFYVLVYRVTSGAYLSIVSDREVNV